MLEGGGEVSGNWSREVRRRRGNVCKEGASPAKHYDVISTVLLRIFLKLIFVIDAVSVLCYKRGL